MYKCYLLQEWQITNLSEDDVGGGARVVSAGRRSNRDEIMEICRLVGCEDVVIKWQELAFGDFMSVQKGFRFLKTARVREFWICWGYLRLRKLVEKRFAVIKFGVNSGGARPVVPLSRPPENLQIIWAMPEAANECNCLCLLFVCRYDIARRQTSRKRAAATRRSSTSTTVTGL